MRLGCVNVRKSGFDVRKVLAMLQACFGRRVVEAGVVNGPFRRVGRLRLRSAGAS